MASPRCRCPFGGGKGAKQQWIENEFERLERFEKIYLALDMDKEGELAATEIAGRLGRHRCVRVKLPRKDANDCLVSGVTSRRDHGVHQQRPEPRSRGAASREGVPR